MSTDGASVLKRFEAVTVVVRDQEKFIKMLGIGEDAYATLLIGRTIGTVVNVSTAAAAGAAAVSSGTVATTFFASTSWLAVVGLAPVAMTPIGWVLGAAVLTGGAYYGAMRAFGAYRDVLVDKVPVFINSPIDILGAAMVDMLGAMALRVAAADGAICDAERAHVRAYLVDKWGIEEAYATAALGVTEENLGEATLEEQVAAFARFVNGNPDCKLDVLETRVRELLKGLVEADGEIAPEETAAIARVLGGLRKTGTGVTLPDLRKTWIGKVLIGVPKAAKPGPAS